MESTKQNPLAYFESLIVSNGLNTLLANFIDDAIENTGTNLTHLDKIKGIVRYFDYDINGNNVIEMEYLFESKLESILYQEFNKSKNLINEAVAEMTSLKQDYINFLLLQEKQLQYIINNGITNIKLFPVIKKPIIGIANYINAKYLHDNEKKIIIKIPILEDVSQVINTDNQNISEILGYLKYENDKRQKIMSDEQFELMIGYVKYYVENNSIPNNITKLDRLKISKGLLRFTFWVLHKKLYTTNSIRLDFILLLKQIFSDFDSWEVDTLKRKFGNKDKVTHNGKHFIPEIIKSELRDFN